MFCPSHLSGFMSCPHMLIFLRVIYDHFSSTGEESKTANRTGIQLLGIVVANQMLPYNPATAKGVDERK